MASNSTDWRKDMVGPPTCPETYSRQRSARADKQSQHSNGQFSLRERPGLKGNSQASKLGAPLSSATAATAISAVSVATAEVGGFIASPSLSFIDSSDISGLSKR